MHREKIKLYERRIQSFYNRMTSRILDRIQPLEARFAVSSDPVPYAQRLAGDFSFISEGQSWGKTWQSAWFHMTGVVPTDWKGAMVVARLDFNGEALVFDADGCPLYGLTQGSVFDIHYAKDIYRLIPCCQGGEQVEIWVEAACNHLFGVNRQGHLQLGDPRLHGTYDGKVNHIELCTFDETLWHLRLDYEVFSNLMNYLPENHVRRARILRVLNEGIDLFADNPAKAAACRRHLEQLSATPANASDLTVTAVGHAHIDTGWLWPVRETVRKCGRTFSSQIALLERYPEYVFGASQPQLYAFVKDRYPALYAKIKDYVAQGRWEPQGGMWVEADCNLISGESMIRQFVHGKNFFMDEFGQDVRNLWLPDVFGYSAAMPQILRKCGIDLFLTQKISWSQFNTFPHFTFNWRGIDGSEVVTHFPPENNYNSPMLPRNMADAQDRFVEKDVLDEFVSLFGIGDGGGGPKEEYVERGLRMRDLEGCPKVRFGRACDLFQRLVEKRDLLETWDGELYLELHRGTYTTQARTKRYNRLLENRLRAAEYLCACLPLEHYPQQEFDAVWKDLLKNQFHDIIPGSSIKWVYDDAAEEYEKGLRVCDQATQKAADRLFEKDDQALVLFNVLSHDFDAPVALPQGWHAGTIETAQGERVVCQIEDGTPVARVCVPAQACLTLRKAGAQPAPAVFVQAGELMLENELVRYEFDDNGVLHRAFDKEAGREILVADGNVLTLYEDNPHNFDAWDIDITYEQQALETARGEQSEALAGGPVRQGLRFSLRIGDSRIEQQVFLAAGRKRLDFVTRVDWHERHRMLRVAFPTAIRHDQATFDIQYGFVKRPVHRNTSWDMARFEVAAHLYADLSNSDYGVTLLNDCKYGYKVHDQVLDLNLLRAPTEPDPEADLGEHTFIYSLHPHRGDLVHSDVLKEAALLNHLPLAFAGYRAVESAMPPCKLEGEGLSLEVLKKAEKEDCRILRIVEIRGAVSHGVLKLANPKARLIETDMLEWQEQGEEISGAEPVKLTLQPFEIRTYKLK